MLAHITKTGIRNAFKDAKREKLVYVEANDRGSKKVQDKSFATFLQRS